MKKCSLEIYAKHFKNPCFNTDVSVRHSPASSKNLILARHERFLSGVAYYEEMVLSERHLS